MNVDDVQNDRLIDFDELLAYVGLGKSSVNDRLNPRHKRYDPDFPQPVPRKNTQEKRLWALSKVLAYVASRRSVNSQRVSPTDIAAPSPNLETAVQEIKRRKTARSDEIADPCLTSDSPEPTANVPAHATVDKPDTVCPDSFSSHGEHTPQAQSRSPVSVHQVVQLIEVNARAGRLTVWSDLMRFASLSKLRAGDADDLERTVLQVSEESFAKAGILLGMLVVELDPTPSSWAPCSIRPLPSQVRLAMEANINVHGLGLKDYLAAILEGYSESYGMGREWRYEKTSDDPDRCPEPVYRTVFQSIL